MSMMCPFSPRAAGLLLLASLLLLQPLRAGSAPTEQLEEIRALLRSSKISEAEVAARRLVERFAAEAEAHVQLGGVLMAKQDAAGAVQAFERAAALAPRDSAIQRRLGDAYGFAAQQAGMMAKLGLARKCLAAYERAVSLDPASIPARQSLLMFYQAAPAMVGGGMDKAYAQADEIRRLDPERGRLAFAQLYAAERKWAAAFAEFEAVLEADPDNYLALFQVGRLAALSGERVERGLATLRRALTLTPPTGAAGHEAVHWRLGMLLERIGDRAGARAAYESALQVNPQFLQARDALRKLG